MKIFLTYFIFVITSTFICPQLKSGLSITEKLAYSTVRLEVITDSGSLITGTSFFYNLLHDSSRVLPVLVTNKHVIINAKIGKFYLNEADTNGQLKLGSFKPFIINNFSSYWSLHPDSMIDLAVMLIGPLINKTNESNYKVFYQPIDFSLLPDSNDLKDFTAVEDILMIGYPNGIWDHVNNFPIFRRGITATHPGLNYAGRDEFLIDAACFPGSSGSPVFIYKYGAFLGMEKEPLFGEKLKFIGILYGGPQYISKGEVRIITIPERNDTINVFAMPTNLGNVIKSSKLRDFEKIFKYAFEKK